RPCTSSDIPRSGWYRPSIHSAECGFCRKGDEGFGEGNFRALFESIEADQIKRGVIGTAAE
ncbi:hypothetical protein ACCS78_29810, partial [Rhizobium johnstonii]